MAESIILDSKKWIPSSPGHLDFIASIWKIDPRGPFKLKICGHVCASGAALIVRKLKVPILVGRWDAFEVSGSVRLHMHLRDPPNDKWLALQGLEKDQDHGS